ncbi:hypothetical protein ACP70R_035565 [Stipagrostis hirtigluma subsp. patula]
MDRPILIQQSRCIATIPTRTAKHAAQDPFCCADRYSYLHLLHNRRGPRSTRLYSIRASSNKAFLRPHRRCAQRNSNTPWRCCASASSSSSSPPPSSSACLLRRRPPLVGRTRLLHWLSPRPRRPRSTLDSADRAPPPPLDAPCAATPSPGAAQPWGSETAPPSPPTAAPRLALPSAAPTSVPGSNESAASPLLHAPPGSSDPELAAPSPTLAAPSTSVRGPKERVAPSPHHAPSETCYDPVGTGYELAPPSPSLAAPATSSAASSTTSSATVPRESELAPPPPAAPGYSSPTGPEPVHARPAAETAPHPPAATTAPPPLLPSASPCVFNVYIGATEEAQVVDGGHARNTSEDDAGETNGEDDDDADVEGATATESDHDGGSSHDTDGERWIARLCKLIEWFEATLVYLFGWDLEGD